MAVNGIEIAVGQKWRTRDRDVVGIEAIAGFSDYPIIGDDGITRTLSGRQWRDGDSDSGCDLIELIKDAPAAAPQPTTEPITPTLRDEFAKAAMAGLLANPSGPLQSNSRFGWGYVNCTLSELAQEIWSIADAMLAARGGDK